MLATFKLTGALLRMFGMALSQHPFATGVRQNACRTRRAGRGGVCVAGAARLRAVRRGVLVKCGHEDEAAGRLLNLPNTLHTTLAAGLFFITPAMQNLGVAFQSVPGPKHLALFPVPGRGDI